MDVMNFFVDIKCWYMGDVKVMNYGDEEDGFEWNEWK